MNFAVIKILKIEYFLSKPFFWISCALILAAFLWTLIRRKPHYISFWISLGIGLWSIILASVFSFVRVDAFFVMLSAWFVFISALSLHLLLESLVRRLQRPSRQMLAAVLGTFFLALAVTFLREPHNYSAVGRVQGILLSIIR